MGPTHSYGAGAEKPPKKADFAMKQTNVCRLSGDIIKLRLLSYTVNHGRTIKFDDF